MKYFFMVVATAGAMSLSTHGITEEVEYDLCSCKHVHIGAQSTLRRGVCQRTEAGKCLMQWGANSKQKVPVGNGDSQEEASIKAQEIIRRAMQGDFKIQTQFYPPAEPNASLLEIAARNLAFVPWYEKDGMIESFLLAASTALVRFDVPIDILAVNILRERRGQLVRALLTQGSFSVGPFGIEGRKGCLQVNALGDQVHVYIKTPIATSDSC